MSHLLMETAALRCGLMEKTRGVRIPRATLSDTDYFNILAPLCKEVNIWSTEYVQQLKYQGGAKQIYHPVLEYTKATGLVPILEAIGGEDSYDGKKFVAEYERLLYETYPMTSTHSLYTHGESLVLFPFRRIFLICRV
jgi:trans-aconitate 2-methyltransferase